MVVALNLLISTSSSSDIARGARPLAREFASLLASAATLVVCYPTAGLTSMPIRLAMFFVPPGALRQMGCNAMQQAMACFIERCLACSLVSSLFCMGGGVVVFPMALEQRDSLQLDHQLC